MLDAQYEFAQLIWMTSGDSAAALAPIEATIRAYPGMRDIHATKAQVLMYTAGAEAAFAFVKSSLQKFPDDVRLLRSGVDAATMSDEPQAALDFSERLLRLQPDVQSARVFRAYALLAAGRASEVLPLAEAMCDANPDDQHALGLLAITWRLLGDGRYQELYDYEQFVRPYKLATPEGWDTLEEYLVDLGSALRAHHPFKTHPFSNSEENGSKIADVLEIDDPAIKAFRQALTPPVSEHLRYLGTGDDALRRRNTGDWSIDGIWSVWLQPNGFHHNHVHPAGWLSSACYIELPHRIDAGEHEGWIKFGEPGPVTHPKLPPEHLVKPEPGLLVLFPSYMWHGTVPFGGDEPRLTIALDIVPG
jgi:tetratricopeptide (TPR) repeat protein